MSASKIKGWCPGAHHPMMAADGLVMRIRPPRGEISATQAEGLANLAEAFGSGVIEATSRANLQIRGIAPAQHATVLEKLSALGLMQNSPETEPRMNILVDPFRAAGDAIDQAALGEIIAKGLIAPEFAALPGKFGFLIDAGPHGRRLAAVSGDIRIERAEAGLLLRADGAERGFVVKDEAEAADAALKMTHWFLVSGVSPDGRGRMARHLQSGASLPAALTGDHLPLPSGPPPMPGRCDGSLLVGAAFGQFSAAALRALAAPADKAPIRITPFRMLLLPDVPSSPLPNHPDLITTPDDPLLAVTACVGAPRCAQASVATRSLARQLAPLLPPGEQLHLSGCAKGCARPRPAPLTLTGRAGAFDLVRNGAPWDVPHRTSLTPDELPNALKP